MNSQAQHNFTPGQAVIWYNPKNDRKGVVIQKGSELKVKTETAGGKAQLWPLESDGLVLWKGLDQKTEDRIQKRVTVKAKAQKTEDRSQDIKPDKKYDTLSGLQETISSPTRQYDIEYMLVPADAVITSHNENTFAKNPDYPAICQERNYHSDKTEQFKVINNAKNFDARFVVLKSPTAGDGPPVAVLHNGKFIVMGGNSRAMTIKRSMKSTGVYNAHLRMNCAQFGFEKDDVKSDHILIRVIQGKFDVVNDCARVSRDLNESFTQAKDQNAEASSVARSISQSTIESLSAALDNYDSLAEFYSSSHAAHFVSDLRSDGIITSQNANKWLLPNGALNDAAKDLITKMLVARIVTDKDQLAMLSKSLLNKIAYVIPQLIKLQSTEWDLTADIQKIVEFDIKRAGMDINAYVRQDDMFGEKVELTKCQYTIALAFAEYGVRKLKEKMSQFLESARSNEGESLFDKVTRPEAIEMLFGKDLKTERIEMGTANVKRKTAKIKNPLFNTKIKPGMAFTEAETGRGVTISEANDTTAFIRYSDGKTAMYGLEAVDNKVRKGIWTDKVKNPGKVRRKNPVVGNALIKYVVVFAPYREEDWLTQEETAMAAQKLIRDPKRERIEKWTFADSGSGKLVKREIVPMRPLSGQGPSKIPNPSKRITGMQEVIRKIVSAAGMENEFIQAMITGDNFHLSVENDPYMRLVIEVIGKNQVSVAHYGVQNGDLMRDPEMIFEEQDRNWIQTYFRNDYAGFEQNMVVARDAQGKITRIKSDGFHKIWARNIKAQGFIDAAKKAVSLLDEPTMTRRQTGGPEKIKNPSKKKRKTNPAFLAISALAVKLYKSGKFKKYTDAVKAASKQVMAKVSAKIKNPSIGVTNSQMDVFGKDSPESVNIPIEKGLALLAKASVMEMQGPDGKKMFNFKGSDLYATADGRWLVIAPSGNIINKRVKVSDDAKQMYEQFNHYEFDKSHALKIPFEKKLVPIGMITAIEYDSDKMIYKTDERTGPKERAYVHKFDTPANVFKPKGDKGKFFIIGAMRKPVTERGIEA